MIFTLLGILLSITYLILAISIHEFAHAYAANRLGDPTAKAAGRLTLNPMAHIDPIGTVILPLSLMLISGGGFAFGWGKPTPVDDYNLQNPRKDMGIISIAGPISNLLMATVVSLAMRLLPYNISFFLASFVVVNISLAVFNLLPVGPLDGQKILLAFLPRGLAYEFQTVMNKYGTLLIILLIMPFSGSSPVMAIIEPIIRFILHILLP